MTKEFDTIKKYFRRADLRKDVILGSGDDAAIVRVPTGQNLVMTIDTMVVGRHFFASIAADDLAYRGVAISLSDVAAMGGLPTWLLATLSIEQIDDEWMQSFADGLYSCIDSFNVSLIGGDLIQGPLAMTTQVTGFVPEGKALRRDTAQPGDLIYVSGNLGAAALAIELTMEQRELSLTDEQLYAVEQRFLRPQPQVALGQALLEIASSAIDISDGLAQDLGHILTASGVGARVDVEAVPTHEVLNEIEERSRYELALSGGDDYELCFTVSPDQLDALAQLKIDVPIHCIGQIEHELGLRFFLSNQEPFELSSTGFEHFSES